MIFIGQESGWSRTWQAGVLRKEWREYGNHDGSRVLQSEGQEERGLVGAGDPGPASRGNKGPFRERLHPLRSLHDLDRVDARLTSCHDADIISGPPWGLSLFPSDILTEGPGTGLEEREGPGGRGRLTVPSTPCLGCLPTPDQPSILAPGRQRTGPGPCQSVGTYEAQAGVFPRRASC